jgi:hypothetical protein
MADRVDVKTAIRHGDADALRQLLAEQPARANELVHWGANNCIHTPPLHYVSDMSFEGVLPKGKELAVLEALLEAGADVNLRVDEKCDTPLIGAASLGAEDVGIRLLEAGANPKLRGRGGETALHWAALLGEDRLAARLIEGSDLNLKDDEYHSSPLGWAIHGWGEPPTSNPANHGRQREVVLLLVAAGARVEPELLESVQARANPEIRAALQGTGP